MNDSFNKPHLTGKEFLYMYQAVHKGNYLVLLTLQNFARCILKTDTASKVFACHLMC